MKRCLSILALTILLVCLLPMQVFAAETMPIEDFKAAVAEAVASGNDLVLDKTVLIQEDLDLDMGSSKLIVTNGAQFAVTHGFTLRFTGFLWVRNGELNVNPTATLDVTPGSKVIIGSEGLVLDGTRYESSGGAAFNMVGTLCCGGSLDILPDGSMWIPDGAVASIDNYLKNLGAVHVIGNNAVLDLYGTADVNGYLCIHPSCKFQVHDGSTLNILNDESGCGYLDNFGFVIMGKNTVKLDGLFTTGKSEESTTDGDGAVQLWGTTITASEKSLLGVGTQGDFAMNDATITSTGEVTVGKEGALWVHSNSNLSAEGKLVGEGSIHVGLAGEGVLDLYGTADVAGYLCIHPAGKLQVHDGSTLNILNTENGCGYLDNYGFVIMGKNTVKLDGLCTNGKSEETGEGNGTLELWGTTITATEKSLLGVGYQGNLAMNDATITSSGEIGVGKEGALWVHNNSALTTSGTVVQLGNIHVGMDGKGTMTINGTANTNGYLAVHENGTLNLGKKGVLNILNDENGCGYLDNKGQLQLDGTLNVEGLYTPEVPVPTAKISGVASSGKPKITWSAVEGAVKYEVYRATSKTGSYSRISTTTKTSLTNTSAVAGKTYYYKVLAVDASGNESAYSNIVSRTCDLAQPTNLKTASVASSGKIKLTWDAVEGAAKYEVYRSKTGKDGSFSRISTTTKTSLTNTSADAGVKYYYKVKAVHTNTNANSALSASVSRVCDLPQPVVKTSNVASSGKIKLTWTKIEGAKSYKIYRATSKTGKYSLMKTTTSISYTDTGAMAGKTYYYKVMAIHENSNANSAYSAIVSRLCDLARPTITVKRNDAGKPRISWEKVEGATKYEVWRATSKNGTYKRIATTKNLYQVNKNAVAGTTYYYKVKAIHSNTNANSAFSVIKYIKSK